VLLPSARFDWWVIHSDDSGKQSWVRTENSETGNRHAVGQSTGLNLYVEG